ncbi:hypothetical protein HUU05_30105 [candidate division KSB1 bacterium]|nr:hypothetical protein [candidate division KSB1 bacterium]
MNRETEPPVLEFYEFNTNRIKRLTSLPGALLWGGLALSPDETWLLYSKNESIQSDIILIENFR